MTNRLSLGALAALGLSLLSVDVGAQAPARPQFGALLGANFATLTDTDFSPFGDDTFGASIETRRRVGFQIGAYATLPFAGALSIQPELHYVQKGTKLDIDLDDPEFPVDGEVAIKLAYLEVPVLLRYDVQAGTSFRPFLVAGPSFAYRASCKLGIDAGEFSQDSDCDAADEGETSDDPIKKFDMGGIVGAGVQGMMGTRSISAQVRYSRGFITIAKDPDGASPKNSGISVLFGIGF